MERVSILQLASGKNVEENIDNACAGIQEAAENGSRLVALPEEFATLGLSSEQKYAVAEDYQQGPLQARIAECAAQNHIWVVAGTLPIKAKGNKYYASCIVYDDEGQVKGRYDKIHLFDVTVSDNEAYQESKRIEAGSHASIIDTPVGRIGLAICYDLRFPELFRTLMQHGAEVIIIPSAFTIPTGQAHWEVLLRARAIENLCYVLAPAEVGIRESGKGTYGHSMIIGPWGEILQKIESSTGIINADIDVITLTKIRKDFPALLHRKIT